MLRRKPTALTISPEDLSAFEQIHAYNKALTTYKNTGLDPEGLFLNNNDDNDDVDDDNDDDDQRQRQQREQNQRHSRRTINNQLHNNSTGFGNTSGINQGNDDINAPIDPNDELKPLPGDKARIVRSREERIIGSSTGQYHQQQRGGDGGGGTSGGATGAGAGMAGFARR